MNPDTEKYIEAARTTHYDEDEDIEQRVSLVQAEEILEFYKRECIRAEMDFANDEFGKEEYIEYVKERIFIDYGEDIQDVFIAFNHYGMNTNITDNDREKYLPIIKSTPGLNDSDQNIKKGKT